MTSIPTGTPRRATARTAFLACALLLLAAPSATAQLGGFIKRKAAERVADRAVDAGERQLSEVAPVTGPGRPFGAEELDRMLTSLELSAAARGRADSLGRLEQELTKRIGEIHSTPELDAYNAARLTHSRCRADFSRTRKEDPRREAPAKKLADLMARDPAAGRDFAHEVGRMIRDMSAAVDRGDRAGADRIEAAFYRKHGFAVPTPDHEGAAAMAKACGAPPPAPRLVTERDSLAARVDRVRDARRAAQGDAQEEGRRASGIPAQEYFAMSERVERWYAIAVKGERGARFWSDEEGALFDSRRARIARLFARSRG